MMKNQGFTRLDGLMLCHYCGATYSPRLEKCPSCHVEPLKLARAIFYRKYLCNKSLQCQRGSSSAVCCVSCDGRDSCGETCFNAREWINELPLEGDILCEHMLQEGL